jgi:ABC-type nickel/cobalt efflux system permease component RcnA
LLSELIDLQHQFQNALTGSLRASMGPDGATALLLLLVFSFLYGVFHTLLPGHQKSLVSAYFLSENARYGQGLLVGVLFAVLHAGVAIVALVLVRLVFQFSAAQSLQQASFWTQTVAAWGVIGVGFALFLSKVAGLGEVRRRADLERVRRELGFDLHDRLETTYEPIPWNRFLPFVFFTAVMPCPGTLMVLLFSLSLGAFSLGLAAVVAISLGMAFTLSGISLGIIWMKKRGRGLTRRSPGRATVFAVEAISLAILVVFALLLLPGGTNRG